MSKRGRPEGATTSAVINHVEPSVCKTCGSSERSSYNGCTRNEISGTMPDGRIYTAILWRPCKCLACGQSRIDKTPIYPAQEIRNTD